MKKIEILGATAAQARAVAATGRHATTVAERTVGALLELGVLSRGVAGQRAELVIGADGEPCAFDLGPAQLGASGPYPTLGEARVRVTEEELLAGRGTGWDRLVAVCANRGVLVSRPGGDSSADGVAP